MLGQFTAQTMATVVSAVISSPHVSHPGNNLHFNTIGLAALQTCVNSVLMLANGISDFDELLKTLYPCSFPLQIQVFEPGGKILARSTTLGKALILESDA